jgi:hypothetical protein
VSDPKTTGWWRPRYWLACKLIYAWMRVMPASRYRSELNAALWTLGIKVQAHYAARHCQGQNHD